MDNIIDNIYVRAAVIVGWVVTVCTFGVGTTGNSMGWPVAWLVMACVALLPPVVLLHFWRAPAETMSQRIDVGRR